MKVYIAWFILQATILGLYLYSNVANPDTELVFRVAIISSFVTIWCIGLFSMSKFIYTKFVAYNKF